jgi:hypothetical protein
MSPQAAKHIESLAWPRLLERDHQVTNYSRAGTSLFYSMEQFEATQAAHERVIFTVTNAGRWPGTIWGQGMDRPLGIPGYHQAQYLGLQLKNSRMFPQLAQATREQLIKQLKDIEVWYLGRAQHMPFEHYVHQLMINRIRSLRPDAIIVPIHTPHPSEELAENTVSFADYSRRAIEWFKPHELPQGYHLDWLNSQWEEYHIVCHLTEETNQLVYQHMLTAIETGKWEPELPDKIVHMNPWEYYWRLR